MANNQNKRLPAATLQADLEAFAALQAIEDYSPINTSYSLPAVSEAKTQMQSNQTTETQALAAANSARDNATAKEWEFHNLMLGVKDQIKAQFGADSNELQAIGLKKKSEYKTGRRKTSSTNRSNS